MRIAIFLTAVLLAAPALADRNPATSPDGRWRAEVRTERRATMTTPGVNAIWLIDTHSGKRRKLYIGPTYFERDFWELRWSLDNRFVYYSTQESETSGGTHKVDARTGAEQTLYPGWLIGVLRNGPYRGYVLAQPHRYWVEGGSYNPVVVVRPDGREMFTVPGTKQVEGAQALPRWLRKKGWKTS